VAVVGLVYFGIGIVLSVMQIGTWPRARSRSENESFVHSRIARQAAESRCSTAEESESTSGPECQANLNSAILYIFRGTQWEDDPVSVAGTARRRGSAELPHTVLTLNADMQTSRWDRDEGSSESVASV
jgi:hypothetical protein